MVSFPRRWVRKGMNKFLLYPGRSRTVDFSDGKVDGPKNFLYQSRSCHALQVTRCFFWSLEFSFSWSSLARQRYFRRMIRFTVLGDWMKPVMTPLSDEGGKRFGSRPLVCLSTRLDPRWVSRWLGQNGWPWKTTKGAWGKAQKFDDGDDG